MDLHRMAARADRGWIRARRRLFAATLGLAVLGSGATAQEPPAGAIAAARELIEVKGATNLFDPVVPGVIETAKNMFLQTNISLSKDLNEVAAQLKKDYAAKRLEISTEMARVYAQQFSEKELRDVVAFYKTPLGKRLIEVEPRVVEQSMSNIQSWADRFSEEVIGKFRTEMRKRGHNL